MVTAVPRLTDGTVVLRALQEDDLPALVEQSRDAQTQRWTAHVPPDYTHDDAVAFLARSREELVAGERLPWAIEHEGTFVGLVSLKTTSAYAVEVAFAAHPAHRGRGLVTRAVRLACAHAFREGRLLVLWHAKVGNVASRRVAWRAGFTIGGVTRGTMRGELRDLWSGTLAPDEPRDPRTPWPATPVLEAAGSVATVATGGSGGSPGMEQAHGPRVRLRPWRDDDGDRLPAGPEVDLASGAGDGGPTSGSFAAWLLDRRTRNAEGEVVAWAAVDPASDGLLGGVRLSRLNRPSRPGSGALAVWLLPAARGLGLAQDAVDLALVHAFASEAAGGLGLGRVEAEVSAADRASLRLLRRAGFREAGTGRAELGPTAPDATPADAVHLDLLAGDDRAGQTLEPVNVPVIETARLRLRAFGEDDGPGRGDGPDAASERYLPAGAHPDDATYPAWLARHRRRQDAGECLPWCVADRETDAALGYLALFRMESLPGGFDAEVGYFLYPSARGHGYLPEALAAACTHAFTPVVEGGLGLARLHAETDLGNAASQSVLEKAGFRQWGHDRSAWRNAAGELTDGASYELLATDPRTDRRRTPLAEVTLPGTPVRLRPLRDDDAPRIREACVDPRSQHWLPDLPRPYALEDALGYIARSHAQALAGTGLYFAVADADDDRLVGALGLMGMADPTRGEAEVGYWAHPDERGRSATTHAVRLAVRHAFAAADVGGLGLRRLALKAAEGNTASEHVALATGFTRTGVQRSATRLGDGSWVDRVDFDLLADEVDLRR